MPRKKAADAAEDEPGTVAELAAQVFNEPDAKPKPETERAIKPTFVDGDTIFYHVGNGQRPWREAVLNVKVGASAESIAKTAETVALLNEAFPMPDAAGINAWYNNIFVATYVGTLSAIGRKPVDGLQSLLVTMGEKGTADPGAVILAFGKKYANLTVAEVLALGDEGADYISWLRQQQHTDAYRIIAAHDAYMTVSALPH